MKVNIALVGGQPAPVYNVISVTNPDFVVYVYSTKSENVLKLLKNEITTRSSELCLSPTNSTEIKRVAEGLAQQFASHEVTVNISSGTKAWSHHFGTVFDKCKNAEVVYMDQNNVLWNLSKMTSSQDFIFDMHALFRLYGNPLENYNTLNEYTEEDIAAIPKIEEIRFACFDDFKNLTQVLDKSRKQQLDALSSGQFRLNNGSLVEWEKTDSEYLGRVYMSMLTKHGELRELELSSDHIVELVFNTAWFEVKVAKLLEKWSQSREICLNCRFPLKDENSGEVNDKNEVDVIVNTGGKLLFVECKTQISKPTDIDKFAKVVENYGGSGSKGIFITDMPLSNLARKKCEDNHLLSFSLKTRTEVMGYNGKKKVHYEERNINELYDLLDSELLHSNT